MSHAIFAGLTVSQLFAKNWKQYHIITYCEVSCELVCMHIYTR